MEYSGAVIVGMVLLFSGVTKAIYSQSFIAHVRQYRLLPIRLSALAAMVFIELECGLGISLILFFYPYKVVLFAFILIIGLSLLTIWGLLTNRIENCGCYGAFFRMSPLQSLLLNLVYLILLGNTWFNLNQWYYTAFWKVAVVMGVIFLSGFLAKHSLQFPIIDLSRLKVGKKWNPKWIKAKESELTKEKILIIFLSQHCSLCGQWIFHLNEIKLKLADVNLLGIVPSSGQSKDVMQKQLGCLFPVDVMSSGLFRFLAGKTPTAILLIEGQIKKKWTGQFPDKDIDSVYKSIDCSKNLN